jgi:hypothetical protein
MVAFPAQPVTRERLEGGAVAEKRIARLDDFHLTGAEAHYLRGLNRKRRRAIMAAFRHHNFKERDEAVGRLKAEFAREQAKAADRARFRHSTTAGTREP